MLQYLNFDEKYWKRLEKKIIFPNNIENECWLTNNIYIDSKGYPKTKFKNETIYVYKIIYFMFYKQNVPNGLLIRHLCSNRLCINPYHLELGTYQDNSNDMIKSDRSLTGENHYNSKLTKEYILNMLCDIDNTFEYFDEFYQKYNIKYSHLQKNIKW